MRLSAVLNAPFVFHVAKQCSECVRIVPENSFVVLPEPCDV